MKKQFINYMFFLLVSFNVGAQCRYCKSYEDFKANKWEMLDTIYCKTHTKGHKFLEHSPFQRESFGKPIFGN